MLEEAHLKHQYVQKICSLADKVEQIPVYHSIFIIININTHVREVKV